MTNRYIEQLTKQASDNKSELRDTAVIGGIGGISSVATHHAVSTLEGGAKMAAPAAKVGGSILSRVGAAVKSPGFKKGLKYGAIGTGLGLVGDYAAVKINKAIGQTKQASEGTDALKLAMRGPKSMESEIAFRHGMRADPKRTGKITKGFDKASKNKEPGELASSGKSIAYMDNHLKKIDQHKMMVRDMNLHYADKAMRKQQAAEMKMQTKKASQVENVYLRKLIKD